MIQRMNQMQSNIIKNFGMRDPFENDPFFNNKGEKVNLLMIILREMKG